ncbi:MAG: hypothetical protein ABI565_09355 [Vicinamibacteria bacterium]
MAYEQLLFEFSDVKRLDVPIALALLKIPLGALTAILGLVAVQGGFIPGLSTLDSQQQILAYALLFGFAQQALTYVLDNKAKELASGEPPQQGSTGSTPRKHDG